MFGVVVVGIGIAGSVRIRDLLNPLLSSPSESLKLKGFVSRRDLGQYNDVKQISLEEALQSTEIDAALICTDNQNHEESIRRFLEAGKHVLVEYPMALSAHAAQELWQLAEQKGGPLDEQRSGFPSFSGIARASWLVDLFGDLTVIAATKEEHKEEKYSKVTAHFTTAENRPLTWIEERAPGLKREKKVKYTFTSGVLDTLPAAPRASLGPFMQDQNLFAKKLLGQVSKEELTAEKKRILHCISLAETIKQYCEH